MPNPLADKPGRICCLVLAAGGSTRLGRPKQLLRVDGVPLLLRAVGLGAALCHGRVVTVIGAEHQRMRRLLHRAGAGRTVVYNGAWRQGLASSLRVGLSRAPKGTAAVLILLIDQHAVSADDLTRLINAWTERPNRPAAAAYSGRLGVPAMIPRRHFAAIRRLSGDVGARQLLRDADRVTAVPMPSASFDIDTEADLQALKKTGKF
ncbi:MAG: nucleotidyltransferase family protein [Gammaproteobacteria bacterium]|nr:nucleotidyltransferase family protein [Gammaproteobacteria bacterium]